MLSDTELRSELQQLGFNPGPITAATRSTYLKKLQKLQDANAVPYTNGKYFQDQDEGVNEPLNGSCDEDEEEEEKMSDAELRAQLLRLGHSAGPITAATRSVYIKKLARLQEAAANGHAPQRQEAAARRRKDSPGRGGAPARRPPAAALAAVEEAENRHAASVRRPSGRSPLAADWSEADDEEMDESALSPGSIFAASATPAYSPYQTGLFGSRYQSDASLNDGASGPEPAGSGARYQPESVLENSRYKPEPSWSTSRYEPDSAVDASRYRPSAVSSVSGRYQPQTGLSSGRYQPSSLLPDLGPVSSAYTPRSPISQRDTPPPKYRSSARQTDTLYPQASRSSTLYADVPSSGGYAADTLASPPYKREPAPAEKPTLSLRQRVADWCRPASRPEPAAPPPPTLDYDTCSDSEDGEPCPPAAAAGVTATEQLRQFRARMDRDGAARRRYGSETARSAASHLVPGCILLLALAFFGVLLFSYLSLGRGPEMEQISQEELPAPPQPAHALAVWPICGTDATSPELGCVSAERLEPAVALLEVARPPLLTAARETLCGRRDSAAVPLTELAGLMATPGGDTVSRLRDLAVLVAYNPQLGLRAELAAAETALEAVGVGTPWLCAAAAALAWLLRWAATLAAVAGGALAVRGVVWWQVRRRQQKQQRLYQMVERVLDVVRRHSAAAASDKPYLAMKCFCLMCRQPYVAVDHVRDQLLPPSQRSDRGQVALWNDTVQFIRDRESRVREECVLVAGESHAVWRWLPSTVGPGSPQTGGRLWLGQAFQTNNGVNSPVHTRTSCLKIRHMFDPSCETGQAWVQEVRDALLEKCEGLPVLHVTVDQRNAEGLVYAKFRSDTDALTAFKRIQGCWFDGRLVSVKFIRRERYHERYPEAASAAAPLRPSNALRRSLAEVTRPDLEDD